MEALEVTTIHLIYLHMKMNQKYESITLRLQW